MDNKNWWIVIGIILITAFFLAYTGTQKDAEMQKPTEEEVSEISDGSVVCTPEQKEAIACTLDYSPVCGDDGTTHSNGCSACASGKIDSYTPGECDTDVVEQ
ncbi:Kazal-type serine protease inhibitor family protein [Patescibacteria group bacterium]